MVLSNAHNLNEVPVPEAQRRYGLRVTMPSSDPLRAVLGTQWSTVHWYATAAERDEAMREKAARHAYSRIGDVPSIVLEAIER
jgi:hypothetical protein